MYTTVTHILSPIFQIALEPSQGYTSDTIAPQLINNILRFMVSHIRPHNRVELIQAVVLQDSSKNTTFVDLWPVRLRGVDVLHVHGSLLLCMGGTHHPESKYGTYLITKIVNILVICFFLSRKFYVLSNSIAFN